MKIKKCITTLASLALIAGLMTGNHIEANAASTVNGNKAVTMSSYLIMRNGTLAPTESFKYSVKYLSTTSKMGDPTGTLPSDVTANFTSATTSTTLGTAMNRNTAPTDGTLVSTKDSADVITLNSDEKYARVDFSLDFSGVVFGDVGEYYYLITESSTGTTANPSITYAEPMILQVSIGYTKDATTGKYTAILDTPQYVLYNAKNTGTAAAPAYTLPDTAVTDSTKCTGFTNKYGTYNLTVVNSVTGNQASHDEYFAVTVNIKGATAGTSYAVDLTGAETKTSTNGLKQTQVDNPVKIDTDTTGNGSATFYLKNRQSIKIQGLTSQVTYNVSQDSTTLGNEGYTATAFSTSSMTQAKLISGKYYLSGTDTTNKYYFEFLSDGTMNIVQQAIATETTTNLASSLAWSQNETGTTIVIKNPVSGIASAEYTLSADGKTLSYSKDTATTENNTDAETQMKAIQAEGTYTSTDPVLKGSQISLTKMSTGDLTIAADTTLDFVNSNSGTVDTGVIMSVAPYAAVLLAGLFGMIIFMMKRRNQEEAE